MLDEYSNYIIAANGKQNDIHKNCVLDNNIFLTKNPINLSSVLIKKSLCKFNENEILSDYDLWLNLIKQHEKFYIISDNLINITTQMKSIKQEQILQYKYQNSYENYVTVVTCYFQIKSKQPHDKYVEWMQNFLKIPMNLVVFTDSESYDLIFNLRQSCIAKTKIIILALNNFVMYKHIDYFKYCYEICPLKSRHSTELFMLWAEKPYFLQRAITENYFNSEWFVWTDIGSLRNKILSRDYQYYPNYKKFINIDPNKIILSAISNYATTKLDNDNIPLIYKTSNTSDILNGHNTIYIQGGFYAIHKTMINNFIDLYSNIFKFFKYNQYYAGNDQFILNTFYHKYQNMIHLINAKNYLNITDNIWFTFYSAFS